MYLCLDEYVIAYLYSVCESVCFVRVANYFYVYMLVCMLVVYFFKLFHLLC